MANNFGSYVIREMVKDDQSLNLLKDRMAEVELSVRESDDRILSLNNRVDSDFGEGITGHIDHIVHNSDDIDALRATVEQVTESQRITGEALMAITRRLVLLETARPSIPKTISSSGMIIGVYKILWTVTDSGNIGTINAINVMGCMMGLQAMTKTGSSNFAWNEAKILSKTRASSTSDLDLRCFIYAESRMPYTTTLSVQNASFGDLSTAWTGELLPDQSLEYTIRNTEATTYIAPSGRINTMTTSDIGFTITSISNNETPRPACATIVFELI